jgi:glutamate racemase
MRPTVHPETALTRRAGAFLLALAALAVTALSAPARAEPPWLGALLEKPRITVVVTDSGLGGLSVVADAAEKFRRHGVFESVNLVFVNALFTDQGGYNSLQSREEKLRVFDSALRAMQDRYSPDLILVACNTLSVFIPDTAFARSSIVPVVGIVDDGVEQIAERLRDRPAARNILFATRTTVDEGTHERLLHELGIGADQVVAQACPQLTLHIEQGYDSDYTEMLIDAYVDEALSRLGGTGGPLTVSFNCTHFGYALELWQRAFAARGVAVEAYLDPNTRMVDFLLPEALDGRYEGPEVTVKVVSMIDIPADRQDSIGRYLHAVSPATESALRHFERQPELFEWRGLVAGPEQ